MTTHCHVLGPGALGGLFAFRLHALGFQVSLVARNPVSHQQELTLLTSDSEETIRFSIQGPDAQESISLLWVTTKSYATLEAVTRLSHRFTAETLIVTLGNGMGYHSALSARFPGRLIAGSTTAGCSSPNANTRKLAGEGETRLGWWDRADTPPKWFKKLEQAPWCRHWEPRIENCLLEKLAINSVINPMTALLNITNGELDNHRHKAALDCAITEVATIFRWSGHAEIAEKLPNRVHHVISDTANNSSSMRIDRQRLSLTEHEEILGYLLEEFGGTVAQERPSTPLLSNWLTALRQPYPSP